jgi:transposase
MEMGLSQLETARRLNVGRSVVHRLWNQFQTEGTISRRPGQGRPRVTTPSDDLYLALLATRRNTTTVPQLASDHFAATGRRISATTVRRRLHLKGLYARKPVICVPLTQRHKEARLRWAREHVTWTREQWRTVLFTDESRFCLQSDSGRVLIWRKQGTRFHPSNILERDTYRGGVMVWEESLWVVTQTSMSLLKEL